VKPLVAVSIDVEQSFAPDPKAFEESVESMLSAFSARGWKMTCFVEGEAAARIPGLLKTLAEAGHEVGCHGFVHQDQRMLSSEELSADVDRALEQFAEEGVQCVGYRSPFFLRHPDLDSILGERKMPYDSSCPRIWFPGRYDYRALPLAPHRGPNDVLQVPVGRVRPWLPYSIEHHKALKFLFPSNIPEESQVLYGHSYSFGDSFERPFFNRKNNLENTLKSISTLTDGARLGTIGDLLREWAPVETASTA
jgi:hypothetical protein